QTSLPASTQSYLTETNVGASKSLKPKKKSLWIQSDFQKSLGPWNIVFDAFGQSYREYVADPAGSGDVVLQVL
ncbi:hypothetical protein HK096_007990, partial [Nowakowskiella sp. JEL0078]